MQSPPRAQRLAAALAVARGAKARALASVLLLAFAVVLAWPLPRPRAEMSFAHVIAPLEAGKPMGLGYELSFPRRGEEHDVVVVASRPPAEGRPAARVELHVLDRGRWAGIRETKSFGIAYEMPRSTAEVADSEALAELLAQAIRSNDSGGLGPIDAIPLRPGTPAPTVMRVLDRVAGARGVAIGAAAVGATCLLVSLPHGGLFAALWLALLGLALRAPELSLPFAQDQDVQRAFTGHVPISVLVRGVGLEDRHPPLYFLVLHATQWLGQSEAVVRAPAVVAGALLGPALLWASWLLRGRVTATAALAGLVAAVSVPFIQRSREVSEIPLFALLAVASTASLVRCAEEPSRRLRLLTAASHALALWTYYIAPLVIAGNVLALLAARRLRGEALRALGWGIAFGSPALLLGIATIVRDADARRAASLHPTLAWGERGVVETARLLSAVSLETLGVPVVLLCLALGVAAFVRRDLPVLSPLVSLLATAAGIALVAPFARAQPYYLVAVLPLALLAVAAGVPPGGAHLRPGAALATVLAALTIASVPRLEQALPLYVPSAEAFVHELAPMVASRPERRVAVVAHYDAHVLAYYLARSAGVEMDWKRMREADREIELDGIRQRIVPIARAHGLSTNPDGDAIATLETAMSKGPLLVIERGSFRLERLSQRLDHCEVLAREAAGRLLACASERERSD